MPLVPPVDDYAAAASLGDAEALGHLYDIYSPRVLTAMRIKARGDGALAEDMAQQVWESVARSIRTYESGKSGFGTWLMRVADNVAVSYFRGTLRFRREHLTGDLLDFDSSDPAGGPEEEMARMLMAEHLAAEVDALAPAQRECIRYRFIMGFSLAETARLMKKKENAIKQLQFRALETLRKRLGDAADLLTSSATVAEPSLTTGRATAASLLGGNV